MEPNELKSLKNTNDYKKFKHFASIGIKLEDILPEKIKTYRQWLIEDQRQVKAGSIGAKVFTGGVARGKRYNFTTVFHISQTIPLEETQRCGPVKRIDPKIYIEMLKAETQKG